MEIGGSQILFTEFMVLWGKQDQIVPHFIDDQKVIRERGIFFKKRLAIHYEDIDFIGKEITALTDEIDRISDTTTGKIPHGRLIKRRS